VFFNENVIGSDIPFTISYDDTFTMLLCKHISAPRIHQIQRFGFGFGRVSVEARYVVVLLRFLKLRQEFRTILISHQARTPGL
jgi:hypothetical protein